MEFTEELVQAARNGDSKAAGALLQHYLPGLRAFVRLKAGGFVRAKESHSDLVQSVCREVLQNLEGFHYGGEAGFKHWLYKAALRKIVDKDAFYRAQKRDARRELMGGAIESDDAALLQVYEGFSTPSQNAIAREELERIEAAFEGLPEDYRQVIVLARVVGLSRAEIAQEMGRTEVGVRTLLHRALARLAMLTGTEQA